LAEKLPSALTAGAGGSGVIVDRKDNTYFVLTNHHVVRYPDRYEIETSDGSRYPVYKMEELPGFDVALVQFQSNKKYRVAELGNSDQLAGGANVYATGFPVPDRKENSAAIGLVRGQFQRYQPDRRQWLYNGLQQRSHPRHEWRPCARWSRSSSRD
jgi:S1-C subfamily serine protease